MIVYPVTELNLPKLSIYNERAESRLLHYNEPQPGLFIAETPMVIRRAARVSVGNVFLIPWTFAQDNVDTPALIEQLKAQGFQTAAMALSENAAGCVLVIVIGRHIRPGFYIS